MKKIIYTKTIILIAFSIWGCQSLKTGNKSSYNGRTVKLQKEKNTDFDEVISLKELGDRSLSINDTLGAEFYYSRAVYMRSF